MKTTAAVAIAASLFSVPYASAFTSAGKARSPAPPAGISSQQSTTALYNGADTNILDTFKSILENKPKTKFLMAQSLLLSLVNDEECFTTLDGAQKFADSCALNVIYEDCYEPQPMVGRSAVADHLRTHAAARTAGGRDAKFRIDKISDGSNACGFAWTWTSNELEGLRGTTFVELNDSNQIQYVREIPEPLYKPGDFILEVLKAVTADAVPKPPPEYVQQTPRKANEIAKYLFNEVQGSSLEEAMRFFSESIIYRDFNYEDVLQGKAQVQKFIEDFSFPGITFATQRFDDGEVSTCFTWEVILEGAPEGSAIKGISFYEVDPDSGLVTYVRDVPESGIKPPPVGKLARQLRPALGVLQPVPIGSREGGL
jgi:hypothetical protein